MLLFLVRHALTPMTGKRLTGRLAGHHLSEEGRRQAVAVAERLTGLPFRAVYSSPLERCRETAGLIARRHGIRMRLREGLSETDYGEWAGRSFPSLYRTRLWRELRRNPADFRFPGGETIREAQTRGMQVIEELRTAHPRDVVAVCSHADLIRLIIAGYMGLTLEMYSRISVGPASVSVISFEERGPVLLRLADSGGYDDVIARWKAQ